MTESVDFGQYRVFKDLADDEIKQFEEMMEVKDYEAEQIIFNEGDIGDSIYLLLDGKVEINQALTMQLSKGDYDTRE